MAEQNLGKIVMTPVGEFNTGQEYRYLDLVEDNGSSYVSLIPNNTNPLSSDTWQLVAKKGEDGIGQDGETPNLQPGIVNTIPTDEPASIIRTGTNLNPIFNFNIPKGADGEDFTLMYNNDFDI